jgi:hypothetical protein
MSKIITKIEEFLAAEPTVKPKAPPAPATTPSTPKPRPNRPFIPSRSPKPGEESKPMALAEELAKNFLEDLRKMKGEEFAKNIIKDLYEKFVKGR